MCMYGCVPLLPNRNYHTVNQLYSNTKLKVFFKRLKTNNHPQRNPCADKDPQDTQLGSRYDPSLVRLEDIQNIHIDAYMRIRTDTRVHKNLLIITLNETSRGGGVVFFSFNLLRLFSHLHSFTLKRTSFQNLIKVLHKWKIVITFQLKSIPERWYLPESCRQRDQGELRGCEPSSAPTHAKSRGTQFCPLGVKRPGQGSPDSTQEHSAGSDRQGSGSRGFCHREQISWHPRERNGRPG